MKTTPEITKAVTLLRAGKLVAFPTETVYGLGADAAQASAINRVFEVKKRPFNHPLIVHIAKVEQLSEWAREIPQAALDLAQAFWPGPLTMVLKKQPQVLDRLTAGQDTIGLRIPRHPIAQALLLAFGGGIAAPSANQFTHISPTTREAVYEELGDQVDLILDGGACEVGLESTIIDMSGDEPVILRPGMITAQAIMAVLNVPIAMQQENKVRTPGMHYLHYAPVTKTVLLAPDKIAHFLQTVSDDDLPMALVTHSLHAHPPHPQIHIVNMPTDALHYAHDLYHTLRSLDHSHYKQIVIVDVPEFEEWEAIRDRLFKASRIRI